MNTSSATPSTWTLGLMRHAKSDWADENLTDHDRPLNGRGRRDAPEMARWLADQQFLPAVILASTATRVRQTVDGLLSVWTHEPLVLFSQSLYLPSPQTITEQVYCEALCANGQRPRAALVVAHNPAMEQLVSQLSGAVTRMPTAAVALFECEGLNGNSVQRLRARRRLAVGRPKEI